MTLFEVDEAANRIRDEVDPEANIIFGSTFDQSLDGKIRISVVATGIEAVAQQQRPSQTGGVSLSVIASNPAPQAAYTAPSFSTGAEDRSIARMEAVPAQMPSYQTAPIVAQGHQIGAQPRSDHGAGCGCTASDACPCTTDDDHVEHRGDRASGTAGPSAGGEGRDGASAARDHGRASG